MAVGINDITLGAADVDAGLAFHGEGAPGPRPQYTPDWYAAYLRGPTGNKLAIVCTARQETPA
jgi:hypothetical protein